MVEYSDYGITPEQYHACLDILWKALNARDPGECGNVFTLCAERIAELEEERDQLRTELEEERHKHMGTHCLMAGYQAGANNWNKRAGDAEAALLKYGQHRPECDLYPLEEPSPASCDCGFHELLYKLIELIKEDKDREKKWADAGAIEEGKERI